MTDFLEFGMAVEAPAKGVDMEVIWALLESNYRTFHFAAFPKYLGGYEIKTSGVQDRSVIYRLDGKQVEEDVANAYYGIDENDLYVGRSLSLIHI